MKEKKPNLIFLLIFCSSIGIFLYFTYIAWSAPSSQQLSKVIVALELFLGGVLLYAPYIFSFLLKITFPYGLKIMYYLFIFASVFLGTGFKFYRKFIYWDKLLHISSAMLLTAFGLSIMGYFIEKEMVQKINPLFFILFSFCFGLAGGVFWELYEYTFDGLLHMNMQRFSLDNGENLVGREALLDTMGDLFVNTLGCIFYSCYAYIKIKKDKMWVNTMSLKKK